MSTQQSIGRLIREYKLIEQKKNERSNDKLLNEITFTNLTIMYVKYFVLSCASYFEEEYNIIIEKIAERVQDKHANALTTYIKPNFFQVFNTKGSDKKEWNAGKFYASVGITNDIKDLKQKDGEFKKLEQSFLSIIQTRNNLVHNDFIEYNIGDSFQMLETMYSDGIKYINYIKKLLKIDECDEQ